MSEIKSVRSNFSGFGSLTEYAAYARGVIDDFGTAGGSEFKSGIITPVNGTSLSFANTPSLGNFGASPICIPNYYALLSNFSGNDNTLNPARSLNGLATGQYHRVGDFKINLSTIGSGEKITIVVSGDVNIHGNISYDSNYGNVSNLTIPSLVVIAKGNINIEDSVERIDGLFISLGEINTCVDNTFVPYQNGGVTELSSNLCDEQLTVNGSFIAGRVNFLRTLGVNGGVNDLNSEPAEIFNFSPELYLSSPLLNSDNIPRGEIKTLLIKDLPPIY
jgi:hypothetical protein